MIAGGPSSATRSRETRPRRGLALLAALWLVVMLSAAGLQFATAARERRALGVSAADRGRELAALEGALAEVQARLELTLRAPVRRGARGAAAPRDPWGRLSERLAPELTVGEVVVGVRSVDLGTVLNVNLAGERELAVLVGSLLRDPVAASRIAQAIVDWRDEDDIPRASGAEAAQYRTAGRAVLPTNGPFRTLDDLDDVLGITPDIAAVIRPYLTTDGMTRRINLNAAPEPVLRNVPGITEPLLRTVLAMRSGGRRVETIPALVTAVQGRGRAGESGRLELVRALEESITLDTRDIAIELTVREPRSVQPSRLVAVLRRGDDSTAIVQSRRW